ncbi:hypothetical protein IPH19_03525 [Candidatus Uhrbacteria bacterium]|nr:MAG: hypothetical protein IPH19_03525 [Candidatus Uhrbacteria bacterium]
MCQRERGAWSARSWSSTASMRASSSGSEVTSASGSGQLPSAQGDDVIGTEGTAAEAAIHSARREAAIIVSSGLVYPVP